MVFLKNIRTYQTTIKEANNLQEEFNEEQKKKRYQILICFLTEEVMVSYFLRIFSMILEAKRKTFEGEGLKILTPKQMFERLPIPVAQV